MDATQGQTPRPHRAAPGNLKLIAVLAAFIIVVVAAVLLIFDSKEPEQDEQASMPEQQAEEDRSLPAERILMEPSDTSSLDRVIIHPPERDNELSVRVAGTVFDPEGQPMSGLIVALQRRSPAGEDQDLESAAMSDEAGLYEISVAPGKYTIKAFILSQKRGHDLWFEPENIEIPATGQFAHDIRFIRPRCVIHGMVRRSNGMPLEGIKVALGTPEARDLRRMTTSGDGTFRFEGVAPGLYRFLVERGPDSRQLLFPWRNRGAPESSSKRWPTITVDPNDREIVYDLVLGTPVHVTGTVTISGYEPTPGQKFRLFLSEIRPAGRSQDLGMERFYTSVVGEDGAINLPEVFPGDYTAVLIGMPPGQARPDPVRIFIDPALSEQELHLSFASVGACSLAGRIVDQHGRGISRTRVRIWDGNGGPPDFTRSPQFARSMAICDEEGRFTFTGLRAGRYWLQREQRTLGPAGPILIDCLDGLEVVVGERSAEVELPVLSYELTAIEGELKGFKSPITFKIAAMISPRDGFREHRTWCHAGMDGKFRLSYIPRTETPVRMEVVADLGVGGNTVCTRASVRLAAEGDTFLVIERE